MGEGWNKTVATGVLGLVALSAGAGLGLAGRVAPPPPPSQTMTTAAEMPATLDVHVAGWVHRPGVVSVADGSIVADAISAAGGLRQGANVEAVNLAAPLSPGQQVVVPGPGAAGAEVAETGDGLISINDAPAGELESLPGVGPVLAGRIVAHRETHGRFETIEDLLEVSGIGEAKLASLRDLVRP